MTKPWRKLDSRFVYEGHISILKKRFELPDGSTHEYDIKVENSVAVVFALTEARRVLIAKQFRPGPEKVLFELPAGFIDQGETPLEAARRELLEETGYSGNFIYLGSDIDSAYSTKIRHNFLATDCKKISSQELDASEFIEVIEMELVEFREILKAGEMSDVGTAYMALAELGRSAYDL